MVSSPPRTRYIPAIDKPQPLLILDLPCLLKEVRRSRLPIEHFIGGVKGCDMPGYPRIHAFDEAGDIAKFVRRVIPAGYDEGRDLHSDPEFVHQANIFQDRGQTRLADLLIEFFGEVLDVNIDRVQHLG